jgi:hypothetical protein
MACYTDSFTLFCACVWWKKRLHLYHFKWHYISHDIVYCLHVETKLSSMCQENITESQYWPNNVINLMFSCLPAAAANLKCPSYVQTTLYHIQRTIMAVSRNPKCLKVNTIHAVLISVDEVTFIATKLVIKNPINPSPQVEWMNEGWAVIRSLYRDYRWSIVLPLWLPLY